MTPAAGENDAHDYAIFAPISRGADADLVMQGGDAEGIYNRLL